VANLKVSGTCLTSAALTPDAIQEQDCLVIITDHDTYDFREILKWAKLVVDTRNSTKGLSQFRDKIIKLGAGEDGGTARDSTVDLDPGMAEGAKQLI
jgi:UDP-N-acetyl-D-mannosaminuronate dehydrogenase